MTVKVSNIMFDLHSNVLDSPKLQYTHTNIYERYSSFSWLNSQDTWHHTLVVCYRAKRVLKSEY